jgi:GDP-4-dehydro-6-deoxy-D-mannose reductase
MKKVLITGASGFVGGFLIEHLLSLGDYEVIGTYNSEERLQKSPLKDKIKFIKADLSNKEETKKTLTDTKPEFIYHLAALASAGASFKDPFGTFHTNIDSELNLFESLRELEMKETRSLIFASAEEYGYVQPDDLPVDENTPLRPANPYAVSKIAQDYLAFQYNLSYKLPLIRVRPFNQIGPRQGTGYVASDFAKQIAEIEKGQKEPVIKVGNLDAKRDFTDVRDAVKAYHLILEKGIAGDVYNVGCGTSHKVQEILDSLLKLANVKISVEVDPNKLRPSDIPEIVADNTKVNKLTNWKPEIPFETTIKDILDYWRSIV